MIKSKTHFVWKKKKKNRKRKRKRNTKKLKKKKQKTLTQNINSMIKHLKKKANRKKQHCDR